MCIMDDIFVFSFDFTYNIVRFSRIVEGIPLKWKVVRQPK